jgi:tetratricopeptide (TPR) repeat protein
VLFRSLPDIWQVQQEDANAITYGFDAGPCGVVVFGFGWEDDPARIKEEMEAEGAVFTDIGPHALAGIRFLERELKGPADDGPAWIRQLIASDPRADGLFMLVQYGVVGGPGLTPYLAEFERVLGSLKLTAEGAASPTQGLDHEGLARAILKEIMALDDADLSGVETRYLRIIDEYPDTEQAQESYWRLSNLYLQAYDPPHRAEVIALLERYPATYPGSDYLEQRFATFATPGIGLVQKRLLGLYEDAQQWQQALPIYRQLLPDSKGVADERLPYVPGYAAALEAVGRKLEALTWYRLYLDRATDPEDLVVRVARAGIERLSGAAGAPEADGGAAAGTATLPVKAGGDTVTPAAAPAATAPATPAMAPAANPAATPVAAPSGGPAAAPDAATLAAEGRDRLAKGDYAEALERFRASVALKADPQVQERIKKLEAYLGTAPVGR